MESDQPRRTARRKTAVSSATSTPKPKAATKLTARSPAERRAAPAAAGSMHPELRARMVETAAYFRAERRGFAPGYEIADWLAAEAEIAALISAATPKAKAAPRRKKTP